MRSLLVTLTLLGCPTPDEPPPPTGTTVGPDGGSASGGGAALDVPAGALSAEVEIAIAVQDPGVALPDGWEAAGQVYAITPHGTRFDTEVTLTLPAASLDAEAGGVLVLSDENDTTWEEVADVDWDDDTVSIDTDHLSFWRVARRTSPRPCDHDAATTALAEVDVAGARDLYEGCVEAFPTDSHALVGRALTRLLLANRWSPVATVADWCGEVVQLDETLYGADGFVRALKDAESQIATTTVAELVPARGAATPISALTAPNHGRARLDTRWPEEAGGSYDVVEITIEQGDDATLGFFVPVFARNGWTPESYEVQDFWFYANGDPALTEDSFYGETAEITIDTLGDRPGESVKLSYDITLRSWAEGGRGQLVHFAGEVEDTIDAEAQDYDWPLENRSSVCDAQDCSSPSAIFPEIDYQCEVPDFASVYGVLDDLADEFQAVADDLRAASEDPALGFVIPADALWFLQEDLIVGPTDARAIAAAAEAAVATLKLATMYDLVDTSLAPGDFAGQVTSFDEAWDTGGGGGDDCTRTTSLGDKVATIGDELESHALDLRAGRAAIAREALDTLLASLVDVLDAEQSQGLLRPDAPQSRQAVGAIREDLAAVLASVRTDEPVSLPSSPALKGTIGAFFDAPPTRESLLDDLGVDALVWSNPASRDTCDAAGLGFDEAFLEWAQYGAGAAIIPQRIYDNGFRDNEIPSVANGDLWEPAFDDDDGWPYFLSRDLYSAIDGW